MLFLFDILYLTIMKRVTENIYEYIDYRIFLKDFFNEQKKLLPVFSHRYFAQKAGFGSPSYASHVMDGKRNLSTNSLKKMIKGMALEGKPAVYFECLVNYNQAKDDDNKRYFKEQLDKLVQSREFYPIDFSQLAFYDDWYYPVIRELAVFADWNEDYKKLAKLVKPEITEEKARLALETLLSIGLLAKGEDGNYYEEKEAITAKDVPPHIIKRQRKRYLLKGMEASDNMGPDIRHLSYVTVALGKKSYKEITEKIDELRQLILASSTEEIEPDKVFHVNFQIFPLSEDIHENKN